MNPCRLRVRWPVAEGLSLVATGLRLVYRASTALLLLPLRLPYRRGIAAAMIANSDFITLFPGVACFVRIKLLMML